MYHLCEFFSRIFTLKRTVGLPGYWFLDVRGIKPFQEWQLLAPC